MVTIALLALLAQARPAAEPPPPYSVAALKAALAGKPAEAEAAQIADKLRKWMGKDLAAGAARTDGLDVAWAIEAAGAKEAQALGLEGSFRARLQPLGETGVLATVATLSDGMAMRWTLEVDGKRTGGGQ